jgi:hypothetical protein
MYEVKVTGVFHPGYTGDGAGESSVLSILKELLRYYAGIDWNGPDGDIELDKAEIASEIGGLTERVGVMWDKETDLYTAVEALQSGGARGWQFGTDADGRFTARLDNPLRPEFGTVSQLDVTNLDEVEIDYNSENYATRVDIAYKKDYSADGDDAYLHEINDQYRQDVLAEYHIDKTYPANEGSGKSGGLQTLLYSKEDAAAKAAYLAEYLSKSRPSINGIALFGEKWLGVRIYDLVTVDLRHTYMRRLRSFTREFGGVIKCKVMDTNKNLEQCTNTVDLLFAG